MFHHKRLMTKGLFTLLALSSASGLAAPKYTKKETEIKAVQTERTAPPKAKPSEKPAPTLRQEQSVAGIQTKIANINEQMIGKMQKLIQITPEGDPEKPDFMFRLAELYNEKRQYFNFKARSLDEQIFQAKTEGERQRLKGDQASYEREEKKWLLEAAKTYLQVATNQKYASYQRMDEVLFYLAYMLQQVKRDDEARVFFLRLVKDYPQSRFVPDAYLSFGEYYFAAGDMDAAMKFYDKVTNFPKSRVYGYALYKKAWAFYNLGEFNKTLETFVNVIQLAREGKLDKANRNALEKESKKDAVLAYSRIGTPEKAWPFFQRIGGDYAPKMEERLADVYWEQGKFVDSIKVYHELMRLFPDSPKLCTWEYNVLKNTLSAGSKRDQVQEMQRMAAVYEQFRAGKQKGAKQSDVEECRANTADTLRELATVWHKEAQRTLNRDTYALAQYIYKEYVEKFPKEKDAYDMNFWYGELLFKLGEIESDSAKQRYAWEKAAEQYTRVVKLQPQGKYVKEASYAAVISLLNANAAAPDRPDQKGNTIAQLTQDCSAGTLESPSQRKEAKNKRKPGTTTKEGCAEAANLADKYKPIPIPQGKQHMLDAFDTYLTYVKTKDPNDDQMIRIKYNRARIYYEFNQFGKAIPLFADIAEHHSKHELGVISANLLLDSLNITGKFDSLMKYVDRFLGNPDLMKDQQFATDMRRIKSESRWKQADMLMSQKNYKEAAKQYVEIYNEAPDSPRAPQTLYNAAIAFESARLVGRAIQMRQNLISRHPESPEAKKALYMIAENFHGIAYYGKAAEFYEKFAAKYAGEKEAPDALKNATFFRRGLGDDDKAIDNNNLYIKNYGQRKPSEAARVFFSIGAIYEKERKWDQLLKHLEEFLRKYGSKAPDLKVVAHVKMGEVLWQKSCPLGDGVNGACLKVERVRAGGAASVLASRSKGKRMRIKGKAQCGPETKSKITVVKRGDSRAKEAQQHFATALAIYKKMGRGSVPGDSEEERASRIDVMNYAAAEARFMQGESSYEQLLAVPFPQGLVFDPKLKRKNEESKRKFQAWMKDKQKILEAAQKIYQDVLTFKQAHWSIASAARIGQLFQNFADGLYTAPIPAPSALVTQLKQAGYGGRDIQDAVDTFQDTYCDQLVDEAGPLEAKAIEGLSKCLEKSTELSWFNEWSSLCEAELNQIKPSEFPLAAEMRAEPGYVQVTPHDGILIEDVE